MKREDHGRRRRPPEPREYGVTEETTLLPFLLERVKGSRNQIKSMLARRQVSVAEKCTTKFDYALHPGQTVRIAAPQREEVALPFEVLYEDDEIIVINKPVGMLSIATDTEKQQTAYRMVSDRVKREDPQNRIFIIHRLDKDTSGVLMFAKSEAVKRVYQEKWESIITCRRYLAVTEGVPEEKSGTIHSWLRETSAHQVYSTNHPIKDGKEATTRYKVLEERGGSALLDVTIDSGRKNQIRVHLGDIDCPVTGDRKYGAGPSVVERFGLHAVELSLRHPVTGKEMTFRTSRPKEFQRFFRS